MHQTSQAWEKLYIQLQKKVKSLHQILKLMRDTVGTHINHIVKVSIDSAC